MQANRLMWNSSERFVQEVVRHLANDRSRTAAIAAEVRKAIDEGRKVLVLTERTERLDAIQAALGAESPPLFVLHGRMTRKRRATLIAELDALPPDAPRVLLATGKLVRERFDHPPLDTLVLAMPISWKGTLQQYAGRLHREHAAKTGVRIIDFVDAGHPALRRMWDKRQRGDRTMRYRIAQALVPLDKRVVRPGPGRDGYVVLSGQVGGVAEPLEMCRTERLPSCRKVLLDPTRRLRAVASADEPSSVRRFRAAPRSLHVRVHWVPIGGASA